MTFFVWILTFLLIVNCLVLALLILVQLPKKDAGAGLAFGGGTADALFGAGSGNALTKITKWATVIFIALAIILGELEIKISSGNHSEFEQGVESQQQQHETPMVQPAAPSQNASQPGSTPPTVPQKGAAGASSASPILQLPATTNGK